MAERPPFTPGPWFAVTFDHRLVSGDPSTPEGYDVEVSCAWPDHISVASMGRALTGTLAEREANARLIAAAPEMYAHLREARETLAAVADAAGDTTSHGLIDCIDALLSRVRGETT